MGAPVGSIFELSLRSTVCSQRCINVLHYVVTTESPLTSIASETVALATAANAVNTIGDFFQAALPVNCTFDEIVAQCIRDTLGTRYARQVNNIGVVGGWVAASALTANVSAVITKRTSFSGRWAVGGFHMPGVPGTEQAGGLIAAGAYKAALQAIADEILDDIAPVGGGVYQPVIYHADGLHGGYTTLLSTELQDEVRVMRRRTVGLGI